MSASTTLVRPTLEELRAIIESPVDTPWADVEVGNVIDRCDEISDRYSAVFYARNIDHAELYRYEHTYLAVHTSDAGIVVFDPTFWQFYPDHVEPPYFLGHATALASYIGQQGGFDANINPDPHDAESITPAQCFCEAELNPLMVHAVGSDPLARARYVREWMDALAPLSPIAPDVPWVEQVTQSARSSNELSP